MNNFRKIYNLLLIFFKMLVNLELLICIKHAKPSHFKGFLHSEEMCFKDAVLSENMYVWFLHTVWFRLVFNVIITFRINFIAYFIDESSTNYALS